MYYIYRLTSKISGKYYIGFTNNFKNRMNVHRWATKTKNTEFYNHSRKHGFDIYTQEILFAFENKEEAFAKEVELIDLNDPLCLNLHVGGNGGFKVKDVESWKVKLSAARKGAKPALGMKHTEATKALCGEYGKLRWDIYGRYPDNVINYTFKEANVKFGISRTHYYRLLKQAKSNDLG